MILRREMVARGEVIQGLPSPPKTVDKLTYCMIQVLPFRDFLALFEVAIACCQIRGGGGFGCEQSFCMRVEGGAVHHLEPLMVITACLCITA